MIALAVAATAGVAVGVARGRRRRDGAALAVLLLTVVVPFYGFYLRSFRTLAPPWALGAAAFGVLAVSCAAVWAGAGRRHWRRRVGCVGRWALLVALTLTATWAGARYAYAHAAPDENGLPRWNPLWMPRYSGFAAPLLCVLIGSVIAATPTRPLRWTLAAAVVGLNLWLTAMALWVPTEAPWGPIAGDLLWASHTPGAAVAMDWVYFPAQPHAPPLPGPSYELVRAAGVSVDPPAFRVGETWPFRPGPAVRRLLASVHYVPMALLRRTAAGTQADTIVLWRTRREADFDAYQLPGWHVTSRRVYAVRSVWTWRAFRAYERLVLQKP